MEKGYGLDFVSDNFIETATFENGKIKLPGGNYKTLVVPTSTNMPLATLKKLIELKKQGAKIIFQNLPKSVPGFKNYAEQNEAMQKMISDNKSIIYPSEDIFSDLNKANVQPEKLVETGLKFIRRDNNGDKIYYLVNHTSRTVNQFIPINGNFEEVIIFNPNSSVFGKAKIKNEGSTTLVKVQIKPGESLFLKTDKNTSVKNWNYFEESNSSYNIEGDWNISFLRGGPALPKSETISELKSWTILSKDAENFSGTAKYAIEFENPDATAENWLLKLGDVRESAKVWINDTYLGTLWANPFEINIGKLKKGKNKMTLEVTNLSANRIRAKELRGEEWKNFYEINMVDKDYNKFDATKWNPMPSGILGPVTLTALKKN
ncbi:glycosylhydrolase-like jelly roll fold domain-containing protein [Thalassobellus suaedae]|uniref:Glycosyl hydrolase n=1 Tax=Thalassobellus suaedae TaxID=3074124 RepID=A0ABY9XYC2_9FLAO|nr:glycosyl hydrolase [Flavobacteriaceae bacterium HL-DH14]